MFIGLCQGIKFICTTITKKFVNMSNPKKGLIN